MLFILYVCICFRCSFAFVAAMSIYVVCFFSVFLRFFVFFSYSFCHFERIIRKHNGWNKAIYMCLCEDFKWNATAMSWKMFSRIWYTYTIMHYSSSATKAKQDSFFIFVRWFFFTKFIKHLLTTFIIIVKCLNFWNVVFARNNRRVEATTSVVFFHFYYMFWFHALCWFFFACS